MYMKEKNQSEAGQQRGADLANRINFGLRGVAVRSGFHCH
jgi:hypothetical protein